MASGRYISPRQIDYSHVKVCQYMHVCSVYTDIEVSPVIWLQTV